MASRCLHRAALGVHPACLGASTAALIAGALLISATPAAAAGPEWKLTVTPNADYFLPGHYGVFKVEAENVGDAPTDNSQPIAIEDVPPQGTSAESVAFYDPALFEADLAASPFDVCPTDLLCKWPEGPFAGSLPALPEGKKLVMTVLVEVASSYEGSLEDTARITGGGAPQAEASTTNEAFAEPPFGKLGFDASLSDAAGNPYTQAGGHPDEFSSEFNFGTYSSAEPDQGTTSEPAWPFSGTEILRDPKEVVSALPPGLIVEHQDVPACSVADYFAGQCALRAQVGLAGLQAFGWTEGALRAIFPVYNLQPQGAYPGELGATVGGAPLAVFTEGLRSGSDYGLSATNVAPEFGISRARLILWGVPAEHSHDAQRRPDTCGTTHGEFVSAEEFEHSCELKDPGGPAGVEPTPFLTMPSECSGNPLAISGKYDSWELPAAEEAEGGATLSALAGCNQLSFQPRVEAHPTTNLADAPSGFELDLHVSQNQEGPEGKEDPEGVATPALREAILALPAGLTVNPAAANGLGACSAEQIGLTTAVGITPAHFTEEPAHCPDASKLGTVEVKTPLFHNPLQGSLYLATPRQNPSGALLAAYLVLEGEGVVVKLPGRLHTDQATGQITADFLEDPQLPFEDLRLRLFEGSLGALRTPVTCGTYETTATLAPFSAPESGPPGEPTSTFETSVGAGGASCFRSVSEEPNEPRFRAGSESPQAGAYSPFSLRLVREDGSQEIKGIDTTLPAGLLGRLAGVGECPEARLAAAARRLGTAEQASPSCPLSSEVGTVDVSVGAGPTPLYLSGKAYLAGPYKGAPLSLAVVIPAITGPFDLGTVLVKTALHLDPETARVHVVSDPIPTILQGIPLDLRSITLKLSRPGFTLNPTDCDELGFTGSALSVFNRSAALNQRFQVGGCSALPFKPKLSLGLSGSSRRGGHPALKAAVSMKGGEANIAKAQITLPRSLRLDQGHVRALCSKAQLAVSACPAGAVYGHAKAITPLLEAPLEGPVYLVEGSGHEAPALAAELNGQVQVVLKGKLDSSGGRLHESFEALPDAPVSKLVLSMQGGGRGLLESSTNLCAKPRRALAEFSAQSGKATQAEPLLRVGCSKKEHKKR